MTAVTAPVDVVAKLSTTLAIHHAPHLLPGVLACLASQLQTEPSEGGRRACDVTAVVGLVALLTADGRADLITRVLLAVSPWLTAAPAPTIPTAPPPGGTGLTVRQTEILQLVSYGLSYAAIGRKLFLSADTVRTHLRRAYRLLGAVNAAHAVRIALRCGALQLDD